MQKHVNLVDLVTSFPTHILLQIWRRYRRERALESLIIWMKNQMKVRHRTFQLRELPREEVAAGEVERRARGEGLPGVRGSNVATSCNIYKFCKISKISARYTGIFARGEGLPGTLGIIAAPETVI